MILRLQKVQEYLECFSCVGVDEDFCPEVKDTL